MVPSTKALVAIPASRRSGKHAAALAMATELVLAHERAGIPCRVRIVGATPESEEAMAKELMAACAGRKLLEEKSKDGGVP
jgi:hypothetical protein